MLRINSPCRHQRLREVQEQQNCLSQSIASLLQVLRNNGFSEAELDQMFKTNPARLFGFDVL